MKISAKEWLVIFTELVIAIIISLFSPQLIYFLSKNDISFFVEAIIIGVIIASTKKYNINCLYNIQENWRDR